MFPELWIVIDDSNSDHWRFHGYSLNEITGRYGDLVPIRGMP